MPPRTIDNLGIDASTRYAEGQRDLDQKLVGESQQIPSHTQIDVSAPHFPEELAELLGLRPTGVTWATFSPPAGYLEQRKRLFTYQLIPSMGSEDKQESQAHKILAKLQSVSKEKVEGAQPPQDARQHYEATLAREEEEKEKKVLTNLFHEISLIDKYVLAVNALRNQYHKG